MFKKTFKQFILEKKNIKSVWVILYTKDKIILGKRSPSVNNPNQWNFFGGSVDDGESPIDAAIRELKEETGYVISPSNLKEIAIIDNSIYYAAKINDPQNVKTSKETSKVKSFKLIDLPNNLHSKTENFFDRLDKILE
jgi:8-oxo-dGTP pyrophosphatase MutT (NUDIX family)